MKKFPGKIMRGGGNHHKILLNDEQIKWLRTEYPKTESFRIAEAMGVSIESVRKLARQNGITKSNAGLAEIRKRSSKRMFKSNTRNGCYDRKRGHPVSEATQEGNRKRWEAVQKGILDDPQTIAKKRDPEKWKESLQKRSEERKELIRKERLRMLYGLERKTKIKAVVLYPYKRSQLHHRHNALRRGYLLDVDCSEGTAGRYVIYYNDDTQRSEKFEQNCIKDGFTFMRDE